MAAGLLFALLVALPILFLVVGPWRAKWAGALGAALGLAVGGALTAVGVACLKVTGLASTDAVYLCQAIGDRVNFAGLATCGMIVCVVAAALDIGASVSVAVWEVARTKPDLQPKEAGAAGRRVSMSITGAMMLTLLFVWAGVRLPALLIPIARTTPVREILNSEVFATEMLRLLGGCTALAVTGPLTAFFTVAWLRHSTLTRSTPTARTRAWGLRDVILFECVLVAVLALMIGHTVRQRNAPGAEATGINELIDAGTFDALYAHATADAATTTANDRGLALWAALSKDPSYGPARVALAKLYLEKGWFLLALYEADQAIEIMGEDPAALRVAGKALATMGDADRADVFLERAAQSAGHASDRE